MSGPRGLRTGRSLLLVSVSDREEAAQALAGGADVIDAKDPSRGALGAVTLDTLSGISSAVNNCRPLTAAIGDGGDAWSVEHLAFDYACTGVEAVKVGFDVRPSVERFTQLVTAACLGARMSGAGCGVVAVTYADHYRADLGEARELVGVAASCGAAGVLLDTADKSGPGLTGLASRPAVQQWILDAHRHGLLAAVAGRLRRDDLSAMIDLGADVIGVRGAACMGGRVGRVTAERVAMLAGAFRRRPERERPGATRPPVI